MRKKIIFVLVIAVFVQNKGNAQITASYHVDEFHMLRSLPITEMAIAKDNEAFINNLDRLKVNMFLINKYTSQKPEKSFCKITNEEIQSLGARNLVEILNIISKSNFDCSSISYNQFSENGAWPHEITLLVDGKELYQGMHYSQIVKTISSNTIQSIEIYSEKKKTMLGAYQTISIMNVTTIGTFDVGPYF